MVVHTQYIHKPVTVAELETSHVWAVSPLFHCSVLQKPHLKSWCTRIEVATVAQPDQAEVLRHSVLLCLMLCVCHTRLSPWPCDW